MTTMFSKLSKFRSKSASRNGSRHSSPQGGDYHYSPNDIEYSRYSFSSGKLYPTESPPEAPIAPPLVHLVRRPSSLPLGENTTPIPSVAPLIENFDSDSDDNVSFAECLFPITPPGEVRLGSRFSHESFMSDDDLFAPNDDLFAPNDGLFAPNDELFAPNADFSQGPKKSPLGYDLRKQIENGRKSVDIAMIKKSWPSQDVGNGRRSVDWAMSRTSWPSQDVENGRRSVDMAMIKKSWPSQDVENGRRSVDWAMSRKSWPSQDVENGRRSVDMATIKKSWPSQDVENGRRSVDWAMSRKSWASQDGEGFSDSSIGRRSSFEYKKDVSIESRRAVWEANYKQVWVPNGLERGATRSWTSSSLPEEGIDTGPAVLPPYEDAEDAFLEEFEDYFNNLQVDNVRRIQYPKLELQKIVYLDYASFSLFSNFQVEEHLKILLAQGPCLGSASFSSSSGNPLFKHVADTQNRLLRMLNTTPNHYSIIFTAGFQESFRLISESYPFQKGSPLLVCQDNHAVVRQVIQSAHRAGVKPILFPVTEKELCFHSHDLHKRLRHQTGRHTNNGGLFIYPAQSNLSGMKHSLGWIVEAQQNGWNVCLDASTLLPTSALDLDIHQPDLVVGSFHHMIGYPSGMGFLLVRRESFCVQASPSGESVQFLRNKPADEGEHCHIMCPADNTMNLLQFAALNLGLIQLEHIGFSAIQKRVRSIAQWLVQRLRTFKHKHGDQSYLMRVYGSHAAKDRGSIVSFNVIDPSGTILPPDIVCKLAARCNIHLSVGNFHNPGLSNLLEGHANQRPINDCSVFERVSGFTAVRASFGAVSSFADVYRLVQFLSRFTDEEYLSSEAIGFVEERFSQIQ